MVEAKDKAGQIVYVSYIPDCEPNDGGLYCETYSDQWCDNKIDDFCIHPEDCNCGSTLEVKKYIQDYYRDEVLDLNYDFDNH